MKKNRLILIPVLAAIMLIILACSVNAPFLAPKSTPTSSWTSTGTFTQTPSPTYTPSSTPVPPVSIEACLDSVNCPNAVAINAYFPEGSVRDTNTVLPVDISYTDPVRFSYGWCTIDQQVLTENIKNIIFIFEIDGISYLDLAGTGFTVRNFEDDPYSKYPCFSIGVVLNDWHKNDRHVVSIGMRVINEINDGWDSYPPSDMVYIYDVRPVDLPTATPTATFTNTPKPLPTLPYYTPTPACEANSTIEITNSTGSFVSLTLNGPANYYFDLAVGDTTLWVCSGTYSYTAYGCGGASDVGTMTTGDSHEFYCQ